jgi:hemerythrin-like domain-containing protein
MDDQASRRAFFALAGAGAFAIACNKEKRVERDSPASNATTNAASREKDEKKDSKDPEVTATEDMMREHGVIRRVLVVYREGASRLRTKPAALPSDALQRAAKLMRTFGEDYHEKQLEEAHVFPAVKKAAGSPATTEIDTLITQHQRGREITDYILAVTQKAIGAATAEQLARTLEAFARMYEAHAAREDTLVFPAWKKMLSPKQLDEMGELFESIEHKTFGKDGFDDAVDQVSAIEKSLGLDLATLTAPPPPK